MSESSKTGTPADGADLSCAVSYVIFRLYHKHCVAPDQEHDATAAPIKPANEDALVSCSVSKAVGNVKNDGPEVSAGGLT